MSEMLNLKQISPNFVGKAFESHISPVKIIGKVVIFPIHFIILQPEEEKMLYVR